MAIITITKDLQYTIEGLGGVRISPRLNFEFNRHISVNMK